MMENFDELLNANDFLELPNELLESSSFVKCNTPIKSPDKNSKITYVMSQTTQKSCEIQSTQITWNSIQDKNTETPKPQALKTLDSNSGSINSRPKRAAALAANSSICGMKRKKSTNNENDSDKENIDQNDQKTKTKVKRVKTVSKKSSPVLQDLSNNTPKTQEISVESIEAKEAEIVEFLNERKISKANSILTQQIAIVPEQSNIKSTLQLNCESDPEYDFNINIEESSNLNSEDLSSKLLYPNISNPKLSDFAVNPSHITKNEILNLNSVSNTSLHTPTKIDKTVVYSVTDNLYYDDSNYEKDDLGFTVTRALEPNLEQHKTHLEYQLEIEKEAQNHIDENNNQLDSQNNNQKEQVEDKDTMIYEGIDLLSLDSGKSADELVGFALNVSKVLFSRDELKEGIYALDDGKSRSKNRIPFDVHRTQIVKEALVKKFNYDPKSIESVWKSIRSDLNRKISQFRK